MNEMLPKMDRAQKPAVFNLPTKESEVDPEKEKQVALAEQLYQDAVKMQRSAEELMQALGKTPEKKEEPAVGAKPEVKPMARPMAEPVAKATNNALIGNMPR